MAGETTVGSIVGFLRLDNSDFMRGIREALVAAERLDGKNVEVDVNVDRTGAAARQIEVIEKKTQAVGNTSRRSSGHVRGLVTAIVALGPALVPIAAGAVGLAAAFGGLGVAGIAAIIGIRSEMERATELGMTWRSTLDEAKDSLRGLGTVAAANVLGPFQDGIRDLQERMPRLTEIVGEFATLTGRTGAALVSGLVSAFITLEPLMRDAAGYVLDLSNRFSAAMSGPGIVAFGDYIRSVFPQVMQDIEAIVDGAAHLVAAFAPLGLGTLSALGALTTLIDAIPVEVLSVVATMATGVYLGFQSWRGLKGIVDTLTSALGGVEAMSGRAAGAIRGLQAAAGIIGVAIAGLTMLFAHNAEQQRANEQAVNDYADALRASNGVIDESIAKTAAKILQDQGILDLGREYGFVLADLTQAAIGNADAQARVDAHMQAVRGSMSDANAAGADLGATFGDVGGDLQKLEGALGSSNGQLQSAVQKNKDLEAATRQASGATSNAAIAAQTLATTYGTSTSVYQQVATAQQGIADKAAAATLQMQLENNAAGLLKQSLDLLNGETISAAQAQNTFDNSLATMGTHVSKTGKQITFTTTSINNMSAASVALRGQLLGQITNAQQAAEQYGNLKDSTEAGRQKLIELRKQIIDNAVAHGVDRDAVTAYVNEFLKIPKKVPPTKLQVDTAEALRKKKALQDAINGITGKTVTVTIAQVYRTLGQPAALAVQQVRRQSENGINPNLRGGGPIPGYAAGTIIGPGTGTSDSIAAMVAETGKVLRVSAGEFLSTAASQRKNRAALEAGNRGASLSVAGSGDSGVVTLDRSSIRQLAQALAGIRVVGDFDSLSSRLAGG